MGSEMCIRDRPGIVPRRRASGARAGATGMAPSAAEGGALGGACVRALGSRAWWSVRVGNVRVLALSAWHAARATNARELQSSRQARWLTWVLAEHGALPVASRPWLLLLAADRLGEGGAAGARGGRAVSGALRRLVAPHLRAFDLALTACVGGAYERAPPGSGGAARERELVPEVCLGSASVGVGSTSGADGAYLRLTANRSQLVAEWVGAATGDVLDALALGRRTQPHPAEQRARRAAEERGGGAWQARAGGVSPTAELAIGVSAPMTHGQTEAAQRAGLM